MENIAQYYKLSVFVCLFGIYLASSASAILAYPLYVGLVFGSCISICLHRYRHCVISLLLLSVLLYSFYALLGTSTAKIQRNLAFERSRVHVLEGSLVEDSLLSQTGKQLLRITLKRCATMEHFEGSASGLVPVLCSVDELIINKSSVRVTGSFSSDGDLFIADELEVISIPTLGILRKRILISLKRTMELKIMDPYHRSLALMLLLGQSTDESFLLKQQSIACGCAHTLALSGMHLQLFLLISNSVCSCLFGRARGKRFGCILPLMYVILIGPKPSLVRAMGMYLFSLLPFSRELGRLCSFWVTCFFQLAFFPQALASYGFLYSWAAYGMLMIASLLPRLPFCTTALAIAGTAPASLLLEGRWNLAGLLWAPGISILIHMALLFSLGSLIGIPFSVQAFTGISKLLEALLMIGSEHPWHYHTLGYVLYLLVLLTSFGAILYAKRVFRRRRSQQYELDICLRFTQGDHRVASERESVNDKEVWAEFPSV